MIEIYRKDLNISGVVIQTDIQEVPFGQWASDQQQQYYIDNKLAKQIQGPYFLIEEEKTKVYRLLEQNEQAKQIDDKEQFLIIKIQDEKTSLSYFGVFLEQNYKEQFKKALPYSTFLIEQFMEQIKNWNENKNTFITFENQGESFNVQYLEPTFLLQKKVTPLEINILLPKQAVSQNEQIESLFRKIHHLNQNKDKIQEVQSQQENKLQQYLETDNQLKQAQSKIYNLEAKILQLEQYSSQLERQNQQLLEQVRQLNDTKQSWDSHLSEVFQQNNKLAQKLSQQLNKQQEPNAVVNEKVKPILQKIDDNLYQSKQYILEENKPLEFNVVLKDIDQVFKLSFTDLQPNETFYDVMNEDFTYKFQYPSGKLIKGDQETTYAHSFGQDDQLQFVLLDDGNRKTLKYSINGIEKPAIRLHGVLSQFYVVVIFENDNIPIDNYIEFRG